MEKKEIKKVAIIVSPNYKDYGKKFLADCMAGIRCQDYGGEMKIFITDNETSPESVLFLRKTAPEAELVLNKSNDGFAKGCNDCMRLALAQGFDYIFLVSMHSVLHRSCVSELAKAMDSDERIAVAQARLMLKGEGNAVAGLGNETHFLGFGFSSGYKEEWKGQAKGIKEIFYSSGASMFIRREALLAVGLFDEVYWMYNEDQELPWRMRLNGWRIVLAPDALACTSYDFQRSIRMVYWMDRNRILSILLCYRISTLIKIFPAFVLMEFGQMLFAWKNKWLKDKIRVYWYFLQLKNWAYVIKARQRNQGLRKVRESDILKLITGRISHQEFKYDWKLGLINPVFEWYWKIISKFQVTR